MQNLVIVESPTKARTLGKFLGSKYQVEASMGHIRDLPKSELGIDIEHHFAPRYIIPRDKLKRVNELKKAAASAKNLWLATDPDREGEAIAWHITELLRNSEGKRQKAKGKREVLDEWILARLSETAGVVTAGLEKYDAMTPAKAMEDFVTDLSTWYLRRSRDRRDEAFYLTTYEVLVTLSKLLAPFMPYATEEMYRNLTGERSVHLTSWPVFKKATAPQAQLIEKMQTVRRIVEMGHARRKETNLKVRQPLGKITVYNSLLKGAEDERLLPLIKDELNVKEVALVSGQGELLVELETTLTPELIAEGEARELVRQIQQARKEVGCGLSETVTVTLPDWPEEFTDYIKKETLADELIKGSGLAIKRA